MHFTVCTPTGGVQTAADGSAKTVLQVKGTNGQLKIHRLSLGFDATDSTKQPIEIQFRRQTSAGTMTNNTSTLSPVDESTADSIQATSNRLATVEPADAASFPLLWITSLHPQQSGEYHFPEPIIVKKDSYLGLVIKPASGVQVNARATLFCEE